MSRKAFIMSLLSLALLGGAALLFLYMTLGRIASAVSPNPARDAERTEAAERTEFVLYEPLPAAAGEPRAQRGAPGAQPERGGIEGRQAAPAATQDGSPEASGVAAEQKRRAGTSGELLPSQALAAQGFKGMTLTPAGRSQLEMLEKQRAGATPITPPTAAESDGTAAKPAGKTAPHSGTAGSR